MSGALVYAEVTPDGPHPVALELLAHARGLGVPVSAVALGPGAKEAAGPLGDHGASTVHVWDDPVFAEHPARPAAYVLAELVREHSPEVVLFAQTYDSRDIAGRLPTDSPMGDPAPWLISHPRLGF